MFRTKIFFTFIFILLIFSQPVYAQISSSGFAIVVPVNEETIENASIVCAYEDGIKACIREYDPSMYGIIAEDSAVTLEDSEIENGRPVLTEGISSIRVSGQGGEISAGDFITTSEIPGVGMKASENGYVIGTSLDDYNPENTDDISTIQVTIHIHPATTIAGSQSNLIQFIRKGVTVPIFEPLESLRYLLAVLIIIISFTIGLIYFGRASRAGIEAIGRNPLAKRVIQITVLLNIGLTLAIVLIGLAIAYMILIL